MLQIRQLAPTLFHAIKAVELGCRRIQDDHQFTLRMGSWMSITDTTCFGCLTTCMLMYLSQKTAKELISKFTPKAITPHKSITDRSYAYEIAKDSSDLENFEYAIDCLRFNDLQRVLDFYGFEDHPLTNEVVNWLYLCNSKKFHDESTKTDLLLYADFIRDIVMPKLTKCFSAKQ